MQRDCNEVHRKYAHHASVTTARVLLCMVVALADAVQCELAPC